MATVGEVSEAVATELRERVNRLVSALEDDATDFTEIVQRSNELGELSGTISEFYREIEQMLSQPLQGDGQADDEDKPVADAAEPGGEQGRPESEQNGSTAEEVTKEELLERAREANVHGRSSMSKEELAQAVEAEEGVTKEELLERARDAGIEGRSSMSKDELRAALRDADV